MSKEADKIVRQAYARALHTVQEREAVRRRPVWLRLGYWQALLTYARKIDHFTVDREEFNRAFPLSRK